MRELHLLQPSSLDAAPAAQAVPPRLGAASSEPLDELAQARRGLKIRLLRDLVSRGIYRVPTQALAEKLADVLSD